MSKVKTKQAKVKLYPKYRRHFREKKTRSSRGADKHPSYVVGEGDRVFAVFAIIHDNKKGSGHSNHPLAVNPNKNDRGQAYIRKQMDIRPKESLGKRILVFLHLSKKDDEYVDGRILKALAKNPNLIPPPDVKKLKPWKPPEPGKPKQERESRKTKGKRK